MAMIIVLWMGPVCMKLCGPNECVKALNKHLGQKSDQK